MTQNMEHIFTSTELKPRKHVPPARSLLRGLRGARPPGPSHQPRWWGSLNFVTTGFRFAATVYVMFRSSVRTRWSYNTRVHPCYVGIHHAHLKGRLQTTHESTYGLQTTTTHNRTQHLASLIGISTGYTNMNISTNETGGHRYAVDTPRAIARGRSLG